MVTAGRRDRTETSFCRPSWTTHHVRHNKRFRSEARATAWHDFWEFDCVGSALLRAATLLDDVGVASEPSLSETPVSMTLEEALERCHVWKARSQRIPHAVESTAALAQIVWRDKVGRPSTTSTELRLAYASAVLRSINGLADVLQQQRATATSVSSLCTQLGIPAWLVDIRHESTHNQLPSLPVLRKASSALILYFHRVYWEKLSLARSEQMDRAMSLLMEYEEAARKVNANKALAQPQDNAGEMQSDSSTSDSETISSSGMINGSWGSVLGTCFNSFAVLQNEKSTKKKKPKPSLSKTERKKKQKSPADTSQPSPAACARAFAKANLKLDVLRYTSLSFLVWKGLGNDGVSLCGGVLLPPPSAKANKDDFRQHSTQYTPLLAALCIEWPGFIQCLVVHTVDAILLVEDSGRDSPANMNTRRQLFFLESWVRHFLSRSFFTRVFPAILSTQKSPRSSEFAPLKTLNALGIPLNSLCDRCSGRSTSKENEELFATRGRLATFFAELLGLARVQTPGVDLVDDERALEQGPIEASTATNGNKKTVAATSEVLSLDEIEKLLDGPNGFLTKKPEQGCVDNSSYGEVHTTNLATRSAWVRCESWDPCSIGTLPGLPI
jgi:hypothetical protein